MIKEPIEHGRFVVHTAAAFSIQGCKCRRYDRTGGWLLISHTRGTDRQDFWFTAGDFYLVPSTLMSGGSTVLEFDTSKSEPESDRRNALLAAVAAFEQNPEAGIPAKSAA